MNIVVCVKIVVDSSVDVEVDPRTGRVDENGQILTVNPYDWYAINEAVRIKQRLGEVKITVLSLGSSEVKNTLRKCLALGADEAMLLYDPIFENLDSYAKGVVIAKAISLIKHDLILCGLTAIDSNSGQTAAIISDQLNISLVYGVAGIDFSADQRSVITYRKIEGGNREIVEADLPAVLAVDLDDREAIYADLPEVIAAQRADIPEVNQKSLGLSADELEQIIPRTKIISLSKPKARPKRIFTPDPDLLAPERLRLIIQGGLSEKKGELFEGTSEDIALKVVRFIREKKLID